MGVHTFKPAKSLFIGTISFMQGGFTEHLVCGSLRSYTNVLVLEAFMNDRKETHQCPAELYTHTQLYTWIHAYTHTFVHTHRNMEPLGTGHLY